MPFIRPYRPADRAAVGDICVRTADGGGDSRSLYPDLDLMPSIFAWPYVELEPELAFVLDDDAGRAVGYVLGCADTPRFAKRFRDEWLPTVVSRYPEGHEAGTPSGFMVSLLHDPERMVVPELADYPAHLHIDLLPEYQRAGWGRALIDTLFTALAAGGVDAIHLCMVSANTEARAFYDRLGFREIAVPNAVVVTYLGRSTQLD
ncbi:GNAT family N-acetyltransferase [Kribbella deserti]|uniref:GNAT family N-acetyltransferase n=1 Tax=Kribbella deserti TaxID=1926257 RepID=A0ABV6QWW3_9ACTN